MAETLKETEATLKKLVEILHDSRRGFADIGEHIKDQSAKDFFMQESLKRQQFAGDLQNELVRLGYEDYQDIGGTTAGAVHRVWGDVKAHLGGGDHSLLETAESGEDVAKKAYKEALEQKNLPGNIRDILTRQESHVLASHDKVKAMRDNKAA